MEMDEIVYNYVTKIERGRGCGKGRGEYRSGDLLAIPPGTSDIKTNSANQVMKNLEFFTTPDLFYQIFRHHTP
jgi:hypothetical protein